MKSILKGKFEIVSVYVHIKGAGWVPSEHGFGGLSPNDSYNFEQISETEYWVSYPEPDDKQFKAKINITP